MHASRFLPFRLIDDRTVSVGRGPCSGCPSRLLEVSVGELADGETLVVDDAVLELAVGADDDDYSAATVKLITTAIGALAKDKLLGRAEALRRAMLSVMTDTTRPSNWVPASHPSVWAPFVIVDEGCGGR